MLMHGVSICKKTGVQKSQKMIYPTGAKKKRKKSEKGKKGR